MRAEIDKVKSKGRSISFLVYHQKLSASQTQTTEGLVLFKRRTSALFFFFEIAKSDEELKFFFLSKNPSDQSETTRESQSVDHNLNTY